MKSTPHPHIKRVSTALIHQSFLLVVIEEATATRTADISIMPEDW